MRRRAQTWLPVLTTLSLHRLEAGWLQVGACSRARHLRQATTVMPAQLNARLPGSPDISMLSPELQQQWDVQANMHLGAIRVKPQSNRKVVWQCNKCAAGQPHIWTASVQDRTLGTGCPYCWNKLVCLHNSLASTAPDAAQYWNHSKNGMAPEQIVAGSSFRAEWKCSNCNWEWQASIHQRTHRQSGCPKCSQANKVTQSHPTFLKAQPACLADWDYERNDADDIHPESTSLGSRKQVHWVCSCCPRGQPHRWTAKISTRISQGHGCPVCAGQQACICNSLESVFPAVAAEFDVIKNGYAPSEITSASHKKVWWRNNERGSWRQTVNARTMALSRQRKGTQQKGCVSKVNCT